MGAAHARIDDGPFAANDNWIPPVVSRSYSRNGLNQYTAISGTSFSYDARGNLTSDGSRTFAYDLENRLTQVSGSAAMSLGYDPLGRLRQTTVSSIATDYLYDGDALSAEYNGSTLLRRYVHGPGVDEPLACARVTHTFFRAAGNACDGWTALARRARPECRQENSRAQNRSAPACARADRLA